MKDEKQKAISDKAINLIKNNIEIKNNIALKMKVSGATVDRWIRDNDKQLTYYQVLKTIIIFTGLKQSEILEK